MVKQAPSVQDDFDTNQIVKTVDDHSKEMLLLNNRVEKIEDKFGNHEKIADTLSATAKTAVKMQVMLAETFVTLLQTNESVKNEVTNLVNKSDRNYLIASLKRFGGVAYTLSIIFITALVTLLVQKYWS